MSDTPRTDVDKDCEYVRDLFKHRGKGAGGAVMNKSFYWVGACALVTTVVAVSHYHVRVNLLDAAAACVHRGERPEPAWFQYPAVRCVPDLEAPVAERVLSRRVPAAVVWHVGQSGSYRELLRRDAAGRWWAEGRELKTDAELGARVRELGEQAVTPH